MKKGTSIKFIQKKDKVIKYELKYLMDALNCNNNMSCIWITKTFKYNIDECFK